MLGSHLTPNVEEKKKMRVRWQKEKHKRWKLCKAEEEKGKKDRKRYSFKLRKKDLKERWRQRQKERSEGRNTVYGYSVQMRKTEEKEEK
jgi:hypothetical protein